MDNSSGVLVFWYSELSGMAAGQLPRRSAGIQRVSVCDLLMAERATTRVQGISCCTDIATPRRISQCDASTFENCCGQPVFLS